MSFWVFGEKNWKNSEIHLAECVSSDSSFARNTALIKLISSAKCSLRAHRYIRGGCNTGRASLRRFELVEHEYCEFSQLFSCSTSYQK
jgi:hypothetical protein